MSVLLLFPNSPYATPTRPFRYSSLLNHISSINLGERQVSPLLYLLGSELTLAGERIIPHKLLAQNHHLFQNGDYSFEVAINRLLFNQYPVYRFLLQGVSQRYKFFKIGPVGLYQDLLVHLRLCRFLGIRQYLWQFWFGRTHIPLVK
ncbi:MAG: hypothetical protein ABII21_02670 [bacterium]